MPSFNTNWNRWIAASINRYIELNKPNTMVMYVEGQERRTKDDKDFIEVRQTGVSWEEVSKDVWKGIQEVNVLIQTVIGNDLYNVDRMIGDVIATLPACLPAYKYGDGDAQFGELQLFTPHRVDYYGQIEPKVKLIQASVECSYQIWLT